jgi:hypothetical protein
VVKGAVETSRKNKWPSLFQDGINARRQLASHRHYGFARRYFLGMTLIDALIA